MAVEPAPSPVSVAGSAHIDPLAPGHPGRWSDGDVQVCHTDRGAVPVRLAASRSPEVLTDHFEVHRPGGRLLVLHRLRPDELDDDIAGMIARELAGVLRGAADFERVFTGLVRSTVSDPLTAWSTFYANTLAVLRARPSSPVPGAGTVAPTAAPESSLAAFAPVHARAVAAVVGDTVLDLGSCFGFLPLRLADAGRDVVASDHTPGTMRLLAAVARHTGRGLRTLVCDARAVPLGDAAVDTVTAIHLLEHLPASATEAAMDEMCRVARRRVVVAVPYERTPDPVYGHLRCFDTDALHALGARSGRRYEVTEHHGGWLVCDL